MSRCASTCAAAARARASSAASSASNRSRISATRSTFSPAIPPSIPTASASSARASAAPSRSMPAASIRASPRSISNGGWGHGERKFRGQHPSPEAWAKFTKMLEDGRAHRARTGQSLMVPRDDIVPIPAHVRENLDKQNVSMLAADSVEMFPAETAQSMFDFRAEEVVGKIAPRPLSAHSRRQRFGDADRAVDRTVQARRPADRAASVQRPRSFPVQRKTRARVWSLLRNWLDTLFPGASK